MSPVLPQGWGGSSAWGVQAAPGLVRAWPGTEICFLLLAVLSCKGGRTIWSPLRQPNKTQNAGQALQIPLTSAATEQSQ